MPSESPYAFEAATGEYETTIQLAPGDDMVEFQAKNTGVITAANNGQRKMFEPGWPVPWEPVPAFERTKRLHLSIDTSNGSES